VRLLGLSPPPRALGATWPGSDGRTPKFLGSLFKTSPASYCQESPQDSDRPAILFLVGVFVFYVLRAMKTEDPVSRAEVSPPLQWCSSLLQPFFCAISECVRLTRLTGFHSLHTLAAQAPSIHHVSSSALKFFFVSSLPAPFRYSVLTEMFGKTHLLSGSPLFPASDQALLILRSRPGG